MTQPKPRCLILACGNTLRGDDGVGPWLAEWAEKRFREESRVRVITRQQWTPELAEEIARTQSAPGSIILAPVEPTVALQRIATHHQGAAELLALTRDLYSSLPTTAKLLTIGAGSTELGELFSESVTAALPEACRLIEETVLLLLKK
jgi:hydrogenase maturation protease